MEEITLIGNLGNDPDVRYTNGGEKVVSFSLAVQAGKKAQGEALAHWYTCDAWERLADICEQYLRKGSKVLVRGLPRAEALSEQAGREAPGGPESDGAQAGDAGRQTGGTGPWSGKGRRSGKPGRSREQRIHPGGNGRATFLTAAARMCRPACPDARTGARSATGGAKPIRHGAAHGGKSRTPGLRIGTDTGK